MNEYCYDLRERRFEALRMAKKILVVDDDPHIRDVVKFALDKAGYVPFEAKNGNEAVAAVSRHGPDLMVLDINMPEMDGIEVCKLIRKSSDLPILFLSSRDDEIDRILGLEIGGDDYVTKPFSPRELVARINVILRRSIANAQVPEADEPLSHGLLTLDPEKHLVAWNGHGVELTATTFHILQTLIKNPERVFNRNNIMD